ncbi:movement protein [Grapevine virus F]|uniref:Movement protein n=1 Tax=Grapevine virus F TaxID=1221437 RepID=J7HCY1_9VIRU|nr:movement protein [Grapevine virus F]AFP95343.1 movement protein [Grapevine virus F]
MASSSDNSREVKIFEVKKGATGFEELNKAISRSDVYDNELIERIMPKRTRKCVVHKEISVVNSRVNVEMEIMDDGVVGKLDEEAYPIYHAGCLVVALMPHGRNVKGKVALRFKDRRLKAGKDVIGSMVADLKKGISAHAEFPGYFISTADLKAGYTLQLEIATDELDFKDGVHPFSIQLISIGRFCGEDLDTRYLLQQNGTRMYQHLLNSENEFRCVPKGLDVKMNDTTLVMPEVYETIKKLNLKHHGSDIKKDEHEGGGRNTGPVRGQPE